MSIIKHQAQRIAVFIDTQNLYHSAKSLYGKKVNFAAILDEVVADRQLIRAVAYVISTEEGSEETFFEALTKIGIETKTKDIQVFAGGAKKADWDVGLAVDAITLAPKVDAIVLISGDGDFVPMVQYLQVHSGVQVEVASFGRSASHLLVEQADDFLDLAEDGRRFLIGSRRRKGGSKNGKSKQNNAQAKKPTQKEKPAKQSKQSKQNKSPKRKPRGKK